MAKPIFLAKIDQTIPTDRIDLIESEVKKKLNDEYHVLIVACLSRGQDPIFQVFNVEKLPEPTIEEIKMIIKKPELKESFSNNFIQW